MIQLMQRLERSPTNQQGDFPLPYPLYNREQDAEDLAGSDVLVTSPFFKHINGAILMILACSD